MWQNKKVTSEFIEKDFYEIENCNISSGVPLIFYTLHFTINCDEISSYIFDISGSGFVRKCIQDCLKQQLKSKVSNVKLSCHPFEKDCMKQRLKNETRIVKEEIK